MPADEEAADLTYKAIFPPNAKGVGRFQGVEGTALEDASQEKNAPRRFFESLCGDRMPTMGEEPLYCNYLAA